jgi:hypothetical protein
MMSPWALDNFPPELPLQVERFAWMRRVSMVWREGVRIPKPAEADGGALAERIADGEDFP